MKDIKPPCKVFKSHLVNAFFITPEKLYREFKPDIKKVKRFQDGRIYFVVKRPKIRFKQEKLGKDCFISFKYEKQGFFSRKHRVSISSLIFDSRDIDKSIYPSAYHKTGHPCFVE